MFADSVEATKSGFDPWGKLMVVTGFRTGGGAGGAGVLEEPEDELDDEPEDELEDELEDEPEDELEDDPEDEPEDEVVVVLEVVGATLGSNVETVSSPLLAT
jgi:hypothetical protein